MASRDAAYLRLDKYLAVLYVLITYVSWQLHELGHWFACRITGVEAIFGFNEWKIVSAKGPVVFAVAAGPLTTLLLAFTGFALFTHRSLLVKRVGLLLLVSNSLIGIGGALTSARYAILHPDLYTSEPIWKLMLCPILIAALLLGLKLYTERIPLRSLGVMALITACIGFAAIPVDGMLWSCIEQGNPACMPLAGISMPVIAADTIAAAATALLMLRYKHHLSS